jgi:hypothetical protein
MVSTTAVLSADVLTHAESPVACKVKGRARALNRRASFVQNTRRDPDGEIFERAAMEREEKDNA